MLRRIRTTKKLARRIDLQYFKRPHALRRWRFWLSVAVPILALGWLLTQRAQGGQKAYSSGPLSASHAVFTQQCSLCHVTRAGAFFKEVSDAACLTCHDGPIHHANQTFTPSCSSCHLEHKGSARLSRTAEASCTQCHADLHTRDGKLHYTASISSFDRAHPEFSPLAKDMMDSGQLRLNHYLHMKPELMGPNGKRVQMTCADCHRLTGEHDQFPYAGELVQTAATDTLHVASPSLSTGTIAPVQYANHCAGCHTLQFDTRFEGQQVPHDKPEVVHSFLLKQFQEYIAANPSAIHQIEPPSRQVPGRIRPIRMARNSTEWVQFRVDDAEWLLWTKTCKQCHILKSTGTTLPEIAPPGIRTRWLEHARFDHRAHRMMSCTSCHARVLDSHDTMDVLVPGIQTCRECHRDQARSTEVAEGRCFECHQYHDWSKARRTKGRFSIPEIRGTARLQLPPQ
jgi:hypothetical protein